MKEKKIAFRVIIFAFLMLFSFCAMSISVCAAPDDGSDTVITDDSSSVDDGETIDSGEDQDIVDGGDTAQDGGYDIESGEVDNGYGTDDGNTDDGSVELPTIAVPEDLQEQYEQLRDNYNDYINSIDDLADNLSQYIPNENLDSLPTVAPEDVVAATAEPLPDVEVSDATLFSGIVMWLCVAVGISVVVGVMVSKRTHRKSV